MKKVTQYLSVMDITSLTVATIGLISGTILTPYLYILSAIAVFLPGLLRNIGIINDKDEYQLEASKVSGNIGFRIGGIAASVITISFKTGILNAQQLRESELWTFFVTFLLLIYMISYATYFWGTSRAARIILFITGAFWGVFIILSGWGNPYALGIGLPITIVTFLGLPLLSIKQPKLIGVILVLISILLLLFLIIREIKLTQLGSIAIITLLLTPLLIPGFILINRGKGGAE